MGEYEFKFTDPLENPEWNDRIKIFNNACIFHTSNWAEVLWNSYDYKATYLTQVSGKTLTALLPIMSINSLLTGNRGVSLPFSDYCPPLGADKIVLQQMLSDLIDYAKKSRWKFVEYRDRELAVANDKPTLMFYRHRIDLTQPLDEVYENFRHSTKTNIRKAEKNKVKISFHKTYEALEAHYRMSCIIRKKHGIPPQPLNFFKNIHHCILAQNLGEVVLAEHQGEVIASGVFFYFNKQVIFKYAASRDAFQHLRPNNLLIWEVLKRYVEKGCECFCFGRTDVDNQGLRQFKKGWATREDIISYYKYDVDLNLLPANGRHHYKSLAIFQYMPLPLLKMMGNLLYRHVG